LTETPDVYTLMIEAHARLCQARLDDDPLEETLARDEIKWLAACYPFHAHAFYDALRGRLNAD
jgi:hypothetical protein